MSDSSTSRRDFVKTLAVGAAGTALTMPSVSYGRIVGANDRIRLGMIGVGQITRYHISGFQQEPDVDIAALADVYEPNLQYGADMVEGDVDTYTDFRRIVERDDIDAVVVGTPNHWHAIPSIRACETGKDVYVEKPLADTIEEGRHVVEAARENDRIVQLGTQQRASRHFQEAVELIRGGTLGDVSFVRTWNTSNAYPDGIGSPDNTEPPEGLDWDLWLGPAPEHPFNPNRFGVFLDDDMNFETWGTWRWFWDHGGGNMSDWGVHWLDIVHWAMEEDAPHTISSMGNKYLIEDNRETPDTLQTTYEYPGFTCVYENRVVNDRGVDDHGSGIIFYGTKGTMYLSRGGFRIEPQPGSDLNEMQVDSHGVEPSHRRDFLDSVKSREKPRSTIEVGHRSSSAAVLGNVAFRSGHTIEWDAETETVTNHTDANQYVTASYRDPWSLEA
jgi:predicted dehydrogenase